MAKSPVAKTDPLAEYSAKRHFESTPEPAPAASAPREGPLLFVVQKHAATHLHYDLRLECDGVLLSWAVPKGPSLDRTQKRFAIETEDHPYEYASFEGVIPPKQYGAGEVIVWDCGPYSPDEGGVVSYHDRVEAQRRVREELAAGKLSFTLRGEKLKGSFALVKMKEAKQWLLIKHRDRFETSQEVTTNDRSVLSGIAVEEMKSLPAKRMPALRLAPCGPVAAMPAKLAPMLAESTEAPFRKDGWMWEPKLDGYRVLAFITGDKVTLRSRKGLDVTRDYPGIAAELREQRVGQMVLDGEIVAFDATGRPSFGAMQSGSAAVAFFVFDMPHFAGVDVRDAPYRDRRRYLAQCLLPSPLVRLVHADEDGVELNEAALATGFEGVIGKRSDSRYESGKRSGAWLKVKPVTTAEFLVGGYTTGKGSRAALGAILVGTREGRKLAFASHVGSGFDTRSLAQAKKLLEPLAVDRCPFAAVPELNAPTTWVKPEVVAEVAFHGWTDDGHLRAPVFVRFRGDMDAREIGPGPKVPEIDAVVQQLDAAKSATTLVIGPHQIKLSNLDRVYWPANAALKQPALTKRDLLRYLAQVSPFMLPHLAQRPLTMIRMPDGIGGQRFFQKHWEQARPEFVEAISVFSGHKDEKHEYLLCNNLPTLLWLAQSGTLEFHIWHSRAALGGDTKNKSTDYDTSLESLEASILNFPDYVLFDIDPYIYSGREAKGAEPELNTTAFEKGKEVAFRVRELLATMALEPIVKTSGKTGLHVFVPIKRTLDFDAVRHVSELVGRHLVRLHPEEVTVEWSIPKRTGKIFMDYNMNVRGKTLNVAYSPRGEPGAPVSMPLTWEELANAHPLDFRMTNAIERLAQTGDRWRDALERKQDLERAVAGARKPSKRDK
ncbi:MAG TPA: non-homologous end-joining DNA ligase [Usitatibacter sp.]|nr:non-homologous end-joining DNA ligase [Usitatibacter sp.]